MAHASRLRVMRTGNELWAVRMQGGKEPNSNDCKLGPQLKHVIIGSKTIKVRGARGILRHLKTAPSPIGRGSAVFADCCFTRELYCRVDCSTLCVECCCFIWGTGGRIQPHKLRHYVGSL